MPLARPVMSSDRIALDINVNGERVSGIAESRTLLSDFLRHGVGGACTILLDGRPVRSCLMFAVQAKRHEITTIEGLARDNEMHPLQVAFRKHHGLQCGFCTPGMVLTAVDLLRRNPTQTEESVREGISGNLCRCTGYEGIIHAVLDAAGIQKKRKPE